jgi:hypothetical protein
MSHVQIGRREEVDSWLLVVRSQTASLTPGPSFAHNVGCRCPNCQCEGIFDIYVSRPFQWHQEHPNARCFAPFCRALNIPKSRKTPNLQLFQVLGFTPTLGQSGVTTVWASIRPGYVLYPYLGPLYTRSQGQCSIQIQHSYWCKSWNQAQGLYTRSQGWHTKNLFNLPQVLNKFRTLWPCFGPKAQKTDTIKFRRSICNPWGQYSSIYQYSDVNVLTFISNLGPIYNIKMLKVGPKFFFGLDL